MSHRTIDHQRRAETEHDGDHVGHGKRPSSRSGAEALLRNLGSVGVADGRGASSREGCEAGKEDLGIHN